MPVLHRSHLLVAQRATQAHNETLAPINLIRNVELSAELQTVAVEKSYELSTHFSVRPQIHTESNTFLNVACLKGTCIAYHLKQTYYYYCVDVYESVTLL